MGKAIFNDVAFCIRIPFIVEKNIMCVYWIVGRVSLMGKLRCLYLSEKIWGNGVWMVGGEGG